MFSVNVEDLAFFLVPLYLAVNKSTTLDKDTNRSTPIDKLKKKATTVDKVKNKFTTIDKIKIFYTRRQVLDSSIYVIEVSISSR